ncbi:MAG: SpoIIE family protein phosphatase [Planctomycetota bacterium]|nr:SpoIIE family protein phosphatase [Planctomycetota bacterium]MDA1138309.1 SpoIIE family protein phosphatase [Planctomycetota bacterium]
MKILIADDHELTRFKLRLDLEKWGHEVVAAEDGEQAWEYFQQNEFSIVITDWMMPKIDGLELVQRIRTTERANYIYIIMLTAKAEKNDIVTGMGAGADDFLAKPFHRDELNVRLRAGTRITKLNSELNDTNQRVKRSLEAAARIQRSFLPSSLPAIAGYDFAWDYSPCDELGGDMLNIVPLDQRRLGLYVLDVSGHGVPAALLATALGRVMAPALDATSLLVERNDSPSDFRILEPAEVASRLNKRFSWTHDTGQFFTMVYGILDVETREFNFTSAGHPPILHQRRNAAPVPLVVSGFPIGIAADYDDYEQQSIILEPGDRLFMYSDGLPDAMNVEDEIYGSDRLLKSVAKTNRLSLDNMIKGIMGDLSRWRGAAETNDDIAILAFESAA